MKEVIKGITAIFSSIVFQIVLFIASILPLIILDLPFWKLIIALVIIEIPFFGSFVSAGIWIYAFIHILSEPLGILSFVFFVLFAIIAIYYIVIIVGGIISFIIE